MSEDAAVDLQGVKMMDDDMRQLVDELLSDPTLRTPITDGIKQSIRMALEEEYKGTRAGTLALRIGVDLMRAGARVH